MVRALRNGFAMICHLHPFAVCRADLYSIFLLVTCTQYHLLIHSGHAGIYRTAGKHVKCKLPLTTLTLRSRASLGGACCV